MENKRPMVSNISFYTKDKDGNKKIIKDFSELKFDSPLYFDFTLSGIDELSTYENMYITILYYDKVEPPHPLLSVPEYQINEVWQDTIINNSSKYIEYSLKLSDLSFAHGLREYDFNKDYQNLKIIHTDYKINFQSIDSKELLNLMKYNNKHDLFHTKVSMIPRAERNQK